MLSELHLEHLGVIERLDLVLGPGLTALTGETGAGKTMLVGAVELVVGGRADAALVRADADEARVDARFAVDPEGSRSEPSDPEAVDHDRPDLGADVVLTRVVPGSGRSRAYVDGRPATVAQLADRAAPLVDLHGQHAHQSLLSPAMQRAALDRFAGVDPAPLRAARARLTELEAELAAAGGDERVRARELDLVRFQVSEIDAAGIVDLDEESRLAVVEDTLADVVAHRAAGADAVESISGDSAARDLLGAALRALGERSPFEDVTARLHGVVADLDDVMSDLRGVIETLDDDPNALATVRERRQALRDLCRKYGDDLADVVAFGEAARRRRDELEGHDARLEALEAERDLARQRVGRLEVEIGTARRTAAGALGEAIEVRLRRLAMPHAAVHVHLDTPDRDAAGDRVEFRLAANPGADPSALAKVASGGELARAMLALRLALLEHDPASTGHEGPRTLVFDEVDAGLGGEAAVAVADALAELGRRYQVLVVTHLPQVAAAANSHWTVRKTVQGGRTTANAIRVAGEDRVDEIARMLAGSVTETARLHARELLERTGVPDGAPPSSGSARPGRGAR